MRISTSLLFNRGLNAILDQQTALARTQLQVATGKRILSPADDPAGAKQVLDLGESLALTAQFQANAERAGTRLSVEDSVLGNVTNVLHRARELAIQGLNAGLTDTDRGAIARELEQRLGELLGLANTTDGNGEYLFAGFSSRTTPFTTNGAGAVGYQGDQGRRALQIAPDFAVADGDPGSAVFAAIPNGNGTFATAENSGNAGTGVIDPGSVSDPSAFQPDTYTITFTSTSTFEVRDSSAALVTSGTYQSGAAISFNGVQTAISGAPAVGDSFTVGTSVKQDMFGIVRALANALASPASSATGQARLNNAVNRSLVDLDQALDSVLATRASVGARLNAIDAEKTVNADFELLVREDLSRVENADLAEVVSRLNSQLVSLQAAQQSFARVQNLSLFNFL